MNKRILIIGAGPGVSSAMARKYAKEGYNVALVARNIEKLEPLAKELSELGIQTERYPADISQTDEFRKVLEDISKKGPIDTVLYNASILTEQSLLTLDLDRAKKEFDVNVLGSVVVLQSVLPSLKKSAQPQFLITGGGLALTPYYQYASLSLGKSAIRSVAFMMAQELKNEKIRIAHFIINGMVESGSKFDPDAIAEHFYSFAKNGKETERIFEGA